MNVHYLSNFEKEKSKVYTPIGIRNLFEEAVKFKKGDTEAVFNDKHLNKNLIELYHAGFLALAIKKWIGKEYEIYPCDSPDTYFLDIKTNEAFPVEIMELYFPNETFDNDYQKLAEHIFKTKGSINFPTCHLLISSRLIVENFNVSKLCQEIVKFIWNFERIWFSIYTESIKQWTFFEIFPVSNSNDKDYLAFNLDNDKNLYY